jgi:hypothetical protein
MLKLIWRNHIQKVDKNTPKIAIEKKSLYDRTNVKNRKYEK